MVPSVSKQKSTSYFLSSWIFETLHVVSGGTQQGTLLFYQSKEIKIINNLHPRKSNPQKSRLQSRCTTARHRLITNISHLKNTLKQNMIKKTYLKTKIQLKRTSKSTKKRHINLITLQGCVCTSLIITGRVTPQGGRGGEGGGHPTLVKKYIRRKTIL